MAKKTITIYHANPAHGAVPNNPGLNKILRRFLWVCLIGLMFLCFFAALAIIGLDTGPTTLVLALLMAMAPVPVYGFLALWLDRFEPEPARLLGFAFFWGASVAALVALIINSIGEVIVSSNLGSDAAEVYGGSISAPIVEETAKGSVIFILYWWKRNEINGVIDGVIYAAMVGLGFAMTENVLYYGKGAVEHGVPGAAATFVLRGLISPFAHPIFTSATGIGIGIASMTSRKWLRVVAPIGGLLCAMGLHSTWNTAAGAGKFFGVYLLVMMPVMIAIVVTVIIARGRERRLVATQLGIDRVEGMLSDDELNMLTSATRRRKARKLLKKSSGRQAANVLRSFQDAATEVAFHRARVARGVSSDPDGSRAAELIATFRRLHTEVHAFGAPIAVPLASMPVFVQRR